MALPGSVPSTTNPINSGTPTAHGVAAELPAAREDSKARRVAVLFWVAVALVLLGLVVVGYLAGNWSTATTRGTILAGICVAMFIGAGACAVKATKALGL
jgi:hypothetical protein